MRIFVSSSFEDLREHRAAAIGVLRQRGHEVVAMENFVSGQAMPLRQMLDKSALNAQLAQSYITELMDRARL